MIHHYNHNYKSLLFLESQHIVPEEEAPITIWITHVIATSTAINISIASQPE
jgi:hypothetical protein